MRTPHAPSAQPNLTHVRADARDNLKRALASSETDDEPLTKRARHHGLPAQPHDRAPKAHTLSLPVVAQDSSQGSEPPSRAAVARSQPTAGSAGSRDNHTTKSSAITKSQSLRQNVVEIALDDGLYEEDDWVLSTLRPRQSPPYAESASDETEDAHWAELERVHHISPSSPSRASTDVLGPPSTGGVQPSSPYVPLRDEINSRNLQTSPRVARRNQRSKSKKQLRAASQYSEDSDSDPGIDDTLPPSDDGSMWAPSSEISSPPTGRQRPPLRVNTDTTSTPSAPDYDVAAMSPLTEDSSSAHADDSDFVFQSPVTDRPSTPPSPLPSSSKAVSMTPAASISSASATDRVDPASSSVNPIGAPLASAVANGAPAHDASKVFGKLAQHDEFYDTRVRNIDGDRVQCNGCSRWMKLKNWEKHLKDKCPVYLIQPIKPTPARELLTQKTAVPTMPPRRPRHQEEPTSKSPAIEQPVSGPDADAIFEQIKTDTRVRLVEGEYVQCDACGKWIKIVNWPTHINTKCGVKKRVRKQYWVYVSDED